MNSGTHEPEQHSPTIARAPPMYQSAHIEEQLVGIASTTYVSSYEDACIADDEIIARTDAIGALEWVCVNTMS